MQQKSIYQMLESLRAMPNQIDIPRGSAEQGLASWERHFVIEIHSKCRGISTEDLSDKETEIVNTVYFDYFEP